MDELPMPEFITEALERIEKIQKPGELTGWETVIFEVEDAPGD
jgi:hypothetical protein